MLEQARGDSVIAGEGPNDSEQSIASVRSQIVDGAFLAAVVFGAPAFVASLYRAKTVGWQPIMAFHIAVYLCAMTAVILRRRLAYGVRLCLLLGLWFFLGTAGVFNWGLIGMGLCFFVMGAILAGILSGPRLAGLFLGSALVVVVVMGFAVSTGRLPLTIDSNSYAVAPIAWVAAALSFLLYTAIVVVSFRRLHDFLMGLIGSLIRRSAELRQRNAELAAAHAQRERAETELREREARQALVLNSLPMAFYTAQASGGYGGTWVSEQIDRVSGYTPEQFVGDTALWESRLHPADRASALAEFSRLQETGVISIEYRWRGADGRYRWILDNAVLVRGADGQGQEIIGTWLDITERKRAEEELVRLATIVEQAAEDIMVTDAEGVIQYVNPAFERITGYSKEEAVGQKPRILRSGLHDGAFYEVMWRSIGAGTVWTGNITNKRKDGAFFEEAATISPVKDGDGRVIGYASIKRDITKRLRLEAQLRQAQKMEAIGTLAGGIAHDFNNLLCAMLGYAELAMGAVPEGSKVHRDLTEVLSAGRRASQLIHQILAFSRQTEGAKHPTDLSVVVEDTVRLLRGTLPATIEIREAIASELPPVLGDSVGLQQVLMNICTNAFHAMEEQGGTLAVTLRKATIPAEEMAGYLELYPGGHACLMISDTGHGMDEETRQRIFEPYFTTKPEGKGTGMGLATAHGIVKSHGGTIYVHSEAGRGTLVKIYLPLMEEGEGAASDDEAGMPRGNGERILLVDDEQSVLEVNARLLERLGYSVTAFSVPRAAVAFFEADPSSVDLLITDKTMPKMTGFALAASLRARRPGLPVILATGLSSGDTREKMGVAGIQGLLAKPATLHELGKTVHNVLHSGGEGG